MGTLFRRGAGTFYAKFKDLDGKWHQQSTGTRDRKAADARLREFERRASDPAYAASNETTLQQALEQLLKSRRAKGTAEATVEFYRSKSGHLLRILGAESRLGRLTARAVDSFVEQRLEEGAAHNTVSKELGTLRAALKVAKRRGEFTGDIQAILPNGFSAQYKPKERFLTEAEAMKVLAELTPDRAARVAFILATSARLGESDRARFEDIDLEGGYIAIRGTKTEKAARVVPIVGDKTRDLIEHAVHYAAGTDGLLFGPSGNIRRDLHEACERAGIEPVSPNDLRRTVATWLVQAGVPLHLVSKVLGHTDTRMVERVYGQVTPADLRRGLTRHLEGAEAAEACTTYAPNFGAKGGLGGPGGPSEPTFSPGFPVPRDGIEPPTRGFSILCSTN